MSSRVISLPQNKLPEQFKLDVIRKKYETISPTTVVLLQELERFNKLIKRMGLSLASLQKVRLTDCRQSWGAQGLTALCYLIV